MAQWRVVYQVWVEVPGEMYQAALENARGRLTVVDGHVHRVEVYRLNPEPTLEHDQACSWREPPWTGERSSAPAPTAAGPTTRSP